MKAGPRDVPTRQMKAITTILITKKDMKKIMQDIEKIYIRIRKTQK